MKLKKRNTSLLLSILAIFSSIFLFNILWLSPSVKAASAPLTRLLVSPPFRDFDARSIPSAQTSPITATVTGGWAELLERQPFPYTTPLPDPVPSPLDGTYAKIDPSWPQWWECRRCADYRPAGGIWKLQFDQGVMRIFYDVTGWRSLASFTVSADHLTLFNDPYCPEEPGEYAWKLADGQLKLELISDTCAFGLRGRNLTNQSWPTCLPTNTTSGANDPEQSPGCVDNPVPTPPLATKLPVSVFVHGGDSRFFAQPPDVIAFANGSSDNLPEDIRISYNPDSIPFGLNRVLWWSGDGIEAVTTGSFASMGVQFLGDPQTGWARVLFDGIEVWRGNTHAIWSRLARHGGYIEISGFEPGPHALRAESLNFDYRPVPVASFGFSYHEGVRSIAGRDQPAAGTTRFSERDGMTLVSVPAGSFTMGSDASDPAAEPDEKPAYTTFLDSFWIDQTEVTNAMYTHCVEVGGCTAPMHSPNYPKAEYAEHPVAGVTWFQAQEYCQWAGQRLPTEAEWEKAARGSDGRRYPWGNTAPDASLLNFGGQMGDTMPVGSYPAGASPYSALDMAGNVWEWVLDGYDPNYYAHAPTANPPGGTSANQKVVRGGAWGVDGRAVRSANRFWAFPGRNDTDGFRCVMNDAP